MNVKLFLDEENALVYPRKKNQNVSQPFGTRTKVKQPTQSSIIKERDQTPMPACFLRVVFIRKISLPRDP